MRYRRFGRSELEVLDNFDKAEDRVDATWADSFGIVNRHEMPLKSSV